MQSSTKIILFGGSFDPIHRGHVCVAQHAMQALGASKLIFVPARRSPHKSALPAAGHHRSAMIGIAIKRLRGVSVTDCELARPEPSYTLDTIQYFRQQFGREAVLHWLIGADQLADFDKWHRVDELLAACHVTVMVRAGYPPPDFACFKDIFSNEALAKLEHDSIQTPLIDLSSTDIRRQLAKGDVNPDSLPPGVLEYIRENGLYGFK